jgi:hypothetical protein
VYCFDVKMFFVAFLQNSFSVLIHTLICCANYIIISLYCANNYKSNFFIT